MALAICRECQGQVSTEAAHCPHCGAPAPVRAITVEPGPSAEHTVGAVPAKKRTGRGWIWFGGAIGLIVVLQLCSSLVGDKSSSTSSAPDPIRSAANRIGTDCRMTMRAPAGQTSQDAIDAFAALRNKDEAGFRALMAGGRVTLILEGASARVLDAKYHGNIAIQVRVLSGGRTGQEAWVFEGICK